MTKINFTKDHFNKMCSYLIDMLINNTIIYSRMGTPLNVVELLHATTISSLNGIRLNLTKQIDSFENQDEWIADGTDQSKLEELKSQKEAINLIIGFKRYQLEVEENAKIRKELQAKLVELKDAQKTPDDKIKEIEAQLQDLSTEEF